MILRQYLDVHPVVGLMLREIPPRPEWAREVRAENLGLSTPVAV